MAECHPVGLPVGDGGQGARREGHPRRPAVHAHQRGRRPARADPRRQRHRLPRRHRQPRPRERAATSASTSSPTPTRATIVSEDFQRHRGPRRAVLRLRPGDAAPTTRRRWQYEGTEGAARAARRPRARRARPRGEQAHGAHGARAGERERRSATRRCSTRAASSRSSSGTSPATRPEMVERDLRRPAASSSSRWPRRCATTRGRERTTRVLLRGRLDPAHASACSTSAPRRSSSCCSATSAARRRHHGAARAREHPGLDRHPDAVQHPARLPPDAARRTRTQTLDDYVEHERGARPASGATCDAYIVSLLKAWWGDAATAENDFCFDYLPRITGDHSHLPAPCMRHDRRRRCKGYFLVGENPAVGSANGAAAAARRWPTSTGSWCATSQRSRRATFWQDGPEIETGELRTEDIGTEVFFLPAAAHTEKDGTLHQHPAAAAVAPQGGRARRATAAASCGSATTSAGGSGEQLAGSHRRDGPAAARPDLGLPDRGRRTTSPTPRRCCARSTAPDADGARAVGVHRAEGRRLDRVRLLDLLRRLRRRGQPGRAAASRGREQTWVAPEWGWAWPANRRILYNRASADPDGQAVVASASATSGGTRSRGEWTGARRPRLHRRPSRPTTCPPEGAEGPDAHRAATTRSSCRPTARPGCSRRAGLADGPLPTHYEPQESPVHNPLYGAAVQPGARSSGAARTTRTTARCERPTLPVRRSRPTG